MVAPSCVLGVAVHAPTPAETLATMRRAEDLGVAAAWLTTGGVGPDGLTLLAAAAAQTSRIKLGTSIVPTFPRHPLVVVQQTLVLASIAPGRFRLGVGPSHRPAIETTFGIPFDHPLEHLREYVTILKQGLQQGTIDFDGKWLHAHGRVPNPPNVPVLTSALRQGSYELAGEVADGAISWITPAAFLRDAARPALLRGAARRTDDRLPILVGHVFAAVTDDSQRALQVGRERLAGYARAQFYQEMFAAAGFPEARQGVIDDELVKSIVVHGDEQAVRASLERFAGAGLDELIVSPLVVGSDERESIDRTLRALSAR